MIDLDIIDSAAAERDTPEGREKPRFWRSYNHLEKSKGFEKAHGEEFMPGASKGPGGASRRQFLQLMGASMALAGLSACRRPVENILPYSHKPESIIPGIERYYATSMPYRGVLRGLLVESHEGRPTKVEGNPEHPTSRGATGLFEQASVLNLYDPDRSETVRHDHAETTWNAFLATARILRQQSGDLQLAVLAEPTSSITILRLREQLAQQYPNLRWVTYSAGGGDAASAGLSRSAGSPVRPNYRFSEAEVIVSLDADFLGATETNYVNNTREFAQSRRLDAQDREMSRLYAIESAYSVTGGMADHRLALRSSDVPHVASALARALGTGGSASAMQRLSEKARRYVSEMARDLQQAGPRGLVLPGEAQPPAVHALCGAINSALGSVGTTLELFDISEDAPEEEQLDRGAAATQAEQLTELTADMRDGAVDALLVIGANPVYSAPAELDFAAAMKRVPETIHMGLWVDETAQEANWHLPRAHYLEAWGDGRAYDGTRSVIQPLIAPLYSDAHSEIEVLNLLATGAATPGYDLVRATWQERLPGEFDEEWRRLLHDGFLPDSGYPTTQPAFSAQATPGPSPEARSGPPSEDDIEVVFRLDSCVLDGSFANNAWCQELPDPSTKITWDNVAVMSPATAAAFELESHIDDGREIVDLAEITVGGRSVRLPVWIQPGYADGSIGVQMGYGRNIYSERPHRSSPFWDKDEDTDVYAHGPLANGVGVNVAPLRPSTETHVVAGAEMRKVGGDYLIATTQDHGTLDVDARPLFRIGELDEFRENPDFADDMGVQPLQGDSGETYPPLWAEAHPTTQPAFKESDYYKYQWGMTIDLNTCTGCNACVVACQSENNIPVVGKEEVANGREMHWIRVDRYFVSNEDDLDEPQMVMQPMPCQHCENAPCESVCPVAATVHTPDGMNQMIYNRCIGTRYCSNNCPYKVRRFNFFNWTKTLPLEVQMQKNPDVTVRSRGVMEKCSYCIQRIRHANERTELEERHILDGEVRTACQQVCPADAITFGDVSDPNTEVSRRKRNPRNYAMLAQLDVKPRTSYLARVRNRNPRLAGD